MDLVGEIMRWDGLRGRWICVLVFCENAEN